MGEFLERLRREERKFVSLELDSLSSALLRDWALHMGLDPFLGYDGTKKTETEFHVTVFYTSNSVALPPVDLRIRPVELIPTGIGHLGENNDVPVLLLQKTDRLLEMRQRFERLGLQDEWPEWRPHVSVTYQKTQIKEQLVLPNKTLFANRLIVKSAKA